MKRTSLLIGIVYMLLVGTGLQTEVKSQTHKTSGADFLKICPGARQLALGNAFTGLADDTNTLFWNPAGLFSLTDWGANFMHNSWLVDLQMESFSLVFPNWWDRFRFGVFGLQLWSPPWDNTGGKQPSGEYRDLMMGAGVAVKLLPNWQLGVNGKVIHRKLGGYSTSTVATDLGMLCRFQELGSLGVAVQNLGLPISSHGVKEKLPLSFNLGIGYGIRVGNWLRPTLVSDLSYDALDQRLDSALGIEVWLGDILALRAGFHRESSVTDLTFGLGFRWRFLNVDYTFLPFRGRLTSFSHPLSSYQMALNAKSLLPAPFHIIHPGLKRKTLSHLTPHLGRQPVDTYETLETTVRNHYGSWSEEQIWDFLRQFVLIIDPGDTVKFVWHGSKDALGDGQLSYRITLYQLPDSNLFRGCERFFSGQRKKITPIYSERLPEERLKSQGRYLEHDLLIWDRGRFREGPYLWLVEAIDRDGHRRECREKALGFYLYYTLAPVPLFPKEDQKIRPELTPEGMKNFRWIEVGSKGKGDGTSGEMGTRKRAELRVNLKWKPGRLGVGRTKYEVFLKPAYGDEPYQKVYEGYDLQCDLWLPYGSKPKRYVWYVVAKLGKKQKKSQQRSFILSPIQLSPPQDFLAPDLETYEFNLKTLANLSPVLLQTEERAEVILDRPLIPFVFFKPGSAEVEKVSKEEFLASRDSLVAHLKANPDVVLHIKGYVDAKSDGVSGERARELSLARAAAVRQFLLQIAPELSEQVQVDTLPPEEVFTPRIIERTTKAEELARIEAENRRVSLEASLRRAVAREGDRPEELVSDEGFVALLNRLLARNPDLTMMVGAPTVKQLVASVRALRRSVDFPERIFTYLSGPGGRKIHLHLSAEKLIYKPTMPRIIRSKLGRSFFSVKIDTLRAPTPFRWWMYLAPAKEASQQGYSPNRIPVDSGYVSQNYQLWQHQLSWYSPGPLNLRWNPDNPYLLVLDVELELAGIRNRFLRPIQFQPQKEHRQTYRMVLVQHVFASEASESRFLEARIQDIVKDILALKPKAIEHAAITGHACTIGPAEYNLHLSYNRAQHTYQVLVRQLDVLIGLKEHTEEAKRLKEIFRNQIHAFGFWVPYRFEPQLLRPGMREKKEVVEELNRSPLQRVRNRRTEIQLTLRY